MKGLNRRKELESIGFPIISYSSPQIIKSIAIRRSQIDKILSGSDRPFLVNMSMAANIL